MKEIERVCPICNTVYLVDPYRLEKYGRGSTCSPGCTSTLRRQEYDKKFPPSPCAICGKLVPAKSPAVKAKSKSGIPLCSRECHYKARSLGLAPRPICGPYQSSTVSSPVVETNFGHWLAGLVAAEGCFQIQITKGGHCYNCSFALQLRDDDTPILETIHQTLHLGRLHYSKANKGSNPCLKWVVSSKETCPALVEILSRYPLRARKAQDFEIWKQAVKVWTDPSSLPEGVSVWDTMRDLKAQIEEVRRYKSPVSL